MLSRLLRLTVLSCLIVFSAAAQEVAESPDTSKDQKALTFGGLVQTQLRTTSEADEQTDGAELLLRRVRFSVNTRVNDFISGRIQTELAGAAAGGAAEVNEAYLLLSFDPAFRVLAGKGGRPFGLVDATAAASLIPIERGARFGPRATIGQYRILEELAYSGRSVGVQVLGESDALPVGLTYAAGYFSGTQSEEGPPADIEQLAGRVQIEPIPQLLVGTAITSRVFGNGETGESERAEGYAVDVQYGTYGESGLKLLAQFTAGTFDPLAQVDFLSLQGWAAWRFAVAHRPYVEAAEPLVRVSWGDLDGGALDASDGVLLTPGVNFYAGGNSRLMLNLDVFFPEGRATPQRALKRSCNSLSEYPIARAQLPGQAGVVMSFTQNRARPARTRIISRFVALTRCTP